MDLYKVRQQLSLGIPLTNLNLRVTDYSRVSTDDIKQKNSLRNQIEHFDEMIKNNKNWIYVDGYVDEGITGTSDIKREEFMRMIEDGKNGKFDLIVTKEISRFSRNTLDSIKYTRELLQSGVGVLFVNDNINTILPDAELRLTIMASMAQDEVRRLSERVKFGMNRAIVNGHILGNDRLFGYSKNKVTGNLEVNEEQGKIVRWIYDMFVIYDWSLSKIVRYLNNNNIRTSFNNKFSVSTLSRMLRNPKYKGYYCGRKSEIIDYMTKKVKYYCMDEWVMYEDKKRIPPLISDELWDIAFKKLERRGKKFGECLNAKTIYKNRYPLSGIIFCDEHNSLFYRRKLSKNSDEIVWCCQERLEKGSSFCRGPKVREFELYTIFDDVINNLSIDLEEVIKMLFNLYQVNRRCISNKEINDGNEKIKMGLKKQILKKIVKEYLMKLLLNKIIVLNDGSNKNIIKLKVYLNISSLYIKKEVKDNSIFNIDGMGCFFCKNYEFRRGFDKTRTRRYIVKYEVRCYLSF